MLASICVVALEGVLASAVAGLGDVFATANTLLGQSARSGQSGQSRFVVTIRHPNRTRVRSWTGLELATRRGLPRAAQSVVIVPGLGVESPAQVHRLSKLAADLPRLGPWLEAQRDAGATIASTCAAAFVLAHFGLLDGHRATTTWWLADAFRARFPAVELEDAHMLTQSGPFVCTGAAMSHLDLALHLVSTLGSPQLASRCAKVLVLDKVRRSQAAYVIPNFVRSEDAVVARAAELLSDPRLYAQSVDPVARQLGISTKTLTRRFQTALGVTPHQYRLRMRIDHARELLERGELSVEAIADELGYAEPSAMYRAFKKATGLAPREYASRFAS